MIIRIRDPVHFGVFAPAGAGKGVSLVLPHLLSYPGSTVNVDPKGENFLKASEHRQRRFRKRSVHLNPYGTGGGDGFNPIYFLDPKSPLLLDQCRDIANMLIFRKGTEPDPHWNDNAELVWSVFTYYIAACETDPSRRNLLAVRSIIQSEDAYLASLGIMKQHGGMLKAQADSLGWLKEDELGSVLSTLGRQTAWMDSPPVASCLKRSTFDPLGTRKGELDIYFTIPPERAERMSGLLRLWIGCTLNRLIADGPDESKPVLFNIDEAANVGRMDRLETAITELRGYGIRIGLYFQSINQLQKCYGENAATVMDNLNTQVYFGISNSFETCEAVSKKIGDVTITTRSLNATKGTSRSTGTMAQAESGNASSSLSVTTSEMARRWAKEDEIRTMPADHAFVFHRNMHVLQVKLLKYYDSPSFRKGRTGDDSGLGIAAGLMAACLLLASLLLSGFVAGLPLPASRPSPPASKQLPAASASPAGYATPKPSPLPVRRSGRNSRLPSRSGFMIPIR